MVVIHPAHSPLSPLRVVAMFHHLADDQLGIVITSLSSFVEFTRAVQQIGDTGDRVGTVKGKLVSPGEIEGEFVAGIQTHHTHVVDLGVKLQNLVQYPAFSHVTSPGQESTVQLIAPLTPDFPDQTDSPEYRTLWISRTIKRFPGRVYCHPISPFQPSLKYANLEHCPHGDGQPRYKDYQRRRQRQEPS